MNAVSRQLLLRAILCGFFSCMLAAGVVSIADDNGSVNDGVHRVETGLRVLRSMGCERREAIWIGKITPGKRVMVPFFFFKEHDYFLVIAAEDAKVAEETLDIEMLDLVGIPIACHTGVGEGRIVIAARPVSTGTSYLSMTLPEGSASPVTLAVGCAYR